MLAEKVCKKCRTKESKEWWKCCPEHTTEQGPDVLCVNCKDELHPICCAMNAEDFGVQQLCGYAKNHEGLHTWQTKVEDVQEEDPKQHPYTKIRGRET